MWIQFVSVVAFCVAAATTQTNVLSHEQRTHKCKSLSTSSLKWLAESYKKDRFVKNFLKPIMRVRVPGTEGNKAVQKHIIDTLNNLDGWVVSTDRFEQDTPVGRREFTNIIATSNPNAHRSITLACHHDSKLMKKEFLGATDSAVPCAIMLDVASTLATNLTKRTNYANTAIGLQLLFFDGEEAFVQWSETDSLYGSRHLAEVMATTYEKVDREKTVNLLRMIDVFVLLDLLGAGGTTFHNRFKSTAPLFQRLIKAEDRLKNFDLLKQRFHRYFSNDPASGYIEDDHKPFEKKGVPILHLIPSTFPSVWHTTHDNWHALNYDEIEDLTLLTKVLVSEYLHL